jgi:hypothetical protein
MENIEDFPEAIRLIMDQMEQMELLHKADKRQEVKERQAQRAAKGTKSPRSFNLSAEAYNGLVELSLSLGFVKLSSGDANPSALLEAIGTGKYTLLRTGG